MRKFLPIKIFLVLVLCSASCFAQQPEFVNGKLIDSLTNEPVVFATVRIKNKALGVISNMDGSFSIPGKFKTYGDTLKISSMGYAPREIAISELKEDEVRIIYMKPGVLALSEAVVEARRKRKKRLSARQIVKKAIKNIGQNYPLRPFSLVGYYRDYQLKNKKYINLNEVILEVFDAGFSKLDSSSTKAMIYDYRRNNDFERDTLADDQYDYKSWRKVIINAYLPNYGGNEFTILRVHDAIRNYNVGSYSFVNRLDRDLLKNHDFLKGENTYSDDRMLHTINFKKRFPSHSAFGTLYISHGDYAIHKLEYSVYDESKKKPAGTVNEHDTSGQLLFKVTNEYKRKHGRMYLNYISFHNKFVLSRPPKFVVEEVLVEGDRRCFVVKFNKQPEQISALRLRNYEFRFNNKKVEFERTLLLENQVYLYPKLDNEKERETFQTIAKMAISGQMDNEVFNIDIEDIKDNQGNVLNKPYYEDFDQFREFFVQRVKTNATLPDTDTFMDATKPIFENQQIINPKKLDDYWMNTPLKKIKG